MQRWRLLQSEKRKIDDIIAVDAEGRFAGMVDIQDLPKFKVM